MSRREAVVDLDIPQSDMQLVFDVTEFLETNKESIIKDMSFFISRFLEDEGMFNGPFNIAFNKRFEEVVNSELKGVLLNHFPITIEQARYLIEMMELVGVSEFYFDKDNYA